MSNSDILQTLSFLFKPGDVFEICLIDPKKRKFPLWRNGYAAGKKPIVAGWFDDFKIARETILKAEKAQPVAIYCTLNPVIPALLGRANNRLVAGVGRTKDSEVAEVRHLLIDADPIRPEGISSTDSEKQLALDLIRTIYSDLKKLGWPEPLAGDSGNGAHLIYPIDPNSRELVPDLLKVLDQKYSTAAVNIDTTVANPGRLVKLYGTWTRKGDSTAERPHRIARILSLPDGELS